MLTEDTNRAAVFAAKSYPFYVLIDREGRIAGTQRGAVASDRYARLFGEVGLKAG